MRRGSNARRISRSPTTRPLSPSLGGGGGEREGEEVGSRLAQSSRKKGAGEEGGRRKKRITSEAKSLGKQCKSYAEIFGKKKTGIMMVV